MSETVGKGGLICLTPMFIELFDRPYPSELPSGAAWISSTVVDLGERTGAWKAIYDVGIVGPGDEDEIRSEDGIRKMRAAFGGIRAATSGAADVERELDRIVSVIDEALATGSTVFLAM